MPIDKRPPQNSPVFNFPHDDDQIDSPLLIVSSTGVVRYANDASWIVLSAWNSAVGSMIPERWRQTVRSACETGATQNAVLTIGVISIDLFFVPQCSKKSVLVVGSETTAERESEREKLIHATIYMQSREAIIVLDDEFRTIDLNPAYTQVTGVTEEEALGELPLFIRQAQRDAGLHHEVITALAETGSWQGEVVVDTDSGEEQVIHASLSAIRLHGEEITHYLGLISDITYRRKAEKALQKMAHFDALTGLPNRYLFTDRLQTALDDCRHGGDRLALMIVDLDGFKSINDTFGHRAGDTLLQKVGGAMADAVRTSDTVARLGGDEFAVIARDIKSEHDITIVAQKLRNSISKAVRIDGYEMYVTGSIGIAIFPEDGTEPEILFRRADTAMYRVKTAGKNDFAHAKADRQETIARNLKLQTNLRHALTRDTIGVVYQPQLSTSTGQLVGVEVLARWSVPDIGQVSPLDFVAIAEKHGLIHQLGERVLYRACEQGLRWIEEYHREIPMSVNISARQLGHPQFIPSLYRILNETGFPPALLELEITESVFIENPEETVDTLQELVSRGVSFCIDDFGTQYASLMYIKNFPVGTIKIDQTFIKDIPDDESGTRIVAAIVAMASSLHCRIIAEGVESARQFDYLKNAGCHIVQGYYCGMPMEAQQIAKQFLQ